MKSRFILICFYQRFVLIQLSVYLVCWGLCHDGNIFKNIQDHHFIVIELWCLTPLSTIFQYYRGDQFHCWKKPDYAEKTSQHPVIKSLTCEEWVDGFIRVCSFLCHQMLTNDDKILIHPIRKLY
jgi:bacteriorhodopsin